MIHADSHVAPSRRIKPTTTRRANAALTEADVLAMPEGQYINAAQLDFFQSRLVAIEADLLDRARRTDSELAVGAAGADPVDRASVEEEHRMALANRARDVEQLVEVRAALGRIASGDFG